jgi:hypothetical protein
MANVRPALPVKLFIGLLTSIPEIVPGAAERLASLFGPIDVRSEIFPFDLTHYYDETMGTPICRQFLSFSRLIEPSTIAEIKLKTNELESELASDWIGVLRPVNLDPGYLEQSKIVLASTKNFFHRILISQGIYAEVTLHFQAGEWQSFPWTFPDYKSGRYDPFFSSVRDIYRIKLSEMGVRIRDHKSRNISLS